MVAPYVKHPACRWTQSSVRFELGSDEGPGDQPQDKVLRGAGPRERGTPRGPARAEAGGQAWEGQIWRLRPAGEKPLVVLGAEGVIGVSARSARWGKGPEGSSASWGVRGNWRKCQSVSGGLMAWV